MPQTKITPFEMTNPYKFSAYRTGALSGGTIVYNNENFDTNGNYDTSSGIYWAPISGYYQINVMYYCSVSGAPQDPAVSLYKNANMLLAISRFVNMYNGVSGATCTISILVYLTAGEYIYTSAGRPLDVTSPANNTFSGFLVST